MKINLKGVGRNENDSVSPSPCCASPKLSEKLRMKKMMKQYKDIAKIAKEK